MKPSVWNHYSYTVTDSLGEKRSCTSLELKPVKAMREALAAGADPQERQALLIAVSRGSIGHVQALLKAGANPDQFNEKGLAPLHLAVHGREDKKVDALIKAGANVDIRVPETLGVLDDGKNCRTIPDDSGHTPAMMAARQGNRPLLDRLRAAGASMAGVLHAAVVGEKEAALKAETKLGPFFDRENLVVSLLAEGMDPNATCGAQFSTHRRPGRIYSYKRGGDSSTPLHLCCDSTADVTFGVEPAKALLAAGADPNRGNDMGDTPLHLVESCELASVLIEAGADFKQKNHDGQTPEHTVDNPAVKAFLRAVLRKHELDQMAQIERPQDSGLAPHEEFMVRKNRGRMM